MTAAWYAIVDHAGPSADLVGQDAVIARVRMLAGPLEEARPIIESDADGRAWCRAFPAGSQVPTRGGVMRVIASEPEPFGIMLSADEMLVRTKAERDALAESLLAMTSERDRWHGEAMRWRERYEDQP
jgi:hypothetical protein